MLSVAPRHSDLSCSESDTEEMKVSLANLKEDSADITLNQQSQAEYQSPTIAPSPTLTLHHGEAKTENTTSSSNKNSKPRQTEVTPSSTQLSQLVPQRQFQTTSASYVELKDEPLLLTDKAEHGLHLLTAEKSKEEQYANEVLVHFGSDGSSVEYAGGDSVHPSSGYTFTTANGRIKSLMFLSSLLKDPSVGGKLTRRELLAIAPFEDITVEDAAKLISCIRNNVSHSEEYRRLVSESPKGERCEKNVNTVAADYTPIVTPTSAPQLPLKEGDKTTTINSSGSKRTVEEDQNDVPLKRILGRSADGGIVFSNSSGDYCPLNTPAQAAVDAKVAPYHPMLGPPVRMDYVIYPLLRPIIIAAAPIPCIVRNTLTLQGPALVVPIAEVSKSIEIPDLAPTMSSYAHDLLTAKADASTVPTPPPVSQQRDPALQPTHANTGPAEWDPFFGPPIRRRLPQSGKAPVNLSDQVNRRAWAEIKARDLQH